MHGGSPLQMTETVPCGLFQLYFYENLFNPNENTKIQNNKKLTKRTIETLLNELFSLDKEDNEKKVEQYASDRNNDIQQTTNNDYMFQSQQ